MILEWTSRTPPRRVIFARSGRARISIMSFRGSFGRMWNAKAPCNTRERRLSSLRCHLHRQRSRAHRIRPLETDRTSPAKHDSAAVTTRDRPDGYFGQRSMPSAEAQRTRACASHHPQPGSGPGEHALGRHFIVDGATASKPAPPANPASLRQHHWRRQVATNSSRHRTEQTNQRARHPCHDGRHDARA